jgi:hypothetical protein
MNQTATKYNVRKCNHKEIYSIFSSRSNKLKLVKQTKPVKQASELSYLERVEGFCNDLLVRKYLPKYLTVKDAIEIVITADRLQVSRFEALKHWKICKKGIVISASFLRSVFISRNMLTTNLFRNWKKLDLVEVEITVLRGQSRFPCIAEASEQEAIENCAWQSSRGNAVSELALIRCLRKAFPDLMLGIICPSEVPPSVFSQIKALSLAFHSRLISISTSSFIAVITAINSITSTIVKKTSNKLTPTKVSKDNSLANKDDLFLDFDDLKVKSNYETKPLN